MDLKEKEILGDSIADHWYYRCKARAMTEFLGDAKMDTILDVGAGSGYFSKYLLAQTRARQAWCVDISYDCDSDATEAGKPIYFRRAIQDSTADVVLLMDVLEHVDDDVGLLSSYVERVPKGAQFLISVPAFQFMWSDHDLFLEHRRRYTLNQIEGVARKAGLTVRKGNYYFGAVFPIAAAVRMAGKLMGGDTQTPQSQLKPHHPIVNETLAMLSRMEIPLMRANRLAGLTAFCLAQR